MWIIKIKSQNFRKTTTYIQKRLLAVVLAGVSAVQLADI